MAIDSRYDFLLFYDVENGNPNGDPDAGNMPRLYPETMQGMVTDVALKRKIRDYILLRHEQKPGYDVFVKHRAVLNEQIARAYDGVPLAPKKAPTSEQRETARGWMCRTFWDVRTFGAVMSTGKGEGEVTGGAGQVRGPVQIEFSRSVDAVSPLEIAITRVAFTKREKADSTSSETEMGRKHIVPYGLYVARGFVSAPLAGQTGFDQDDLEALWEALTMMFEHDRSAARGFMSTRALYIFKHGNKLGRAPAHKLFDAVKVTRTGDPQTPPRGFFDYSITVDRTAIPEGIEVDERL